MAKNMFETRFREHVRAEREKRGWSQAGLAKLLQGNGLPYMIASMVAKIETGDRAVRIDEAGVLADIFALSIDVLAGRSIRGGELAWAASNLTSNAQKAAGEVDRLQERLRSGYDDVRVAITRGGEAVDDLIEHAGTAILKLSDAREALNQLANQFPLPTDRGPAP